MQKPQDFDQAQGFTGFEPLEVGGHICKIMNVEETKTRNGKDMIVVYLDTDKTDKQPEYYTKQYQSNNKPDKKWSNNAIARQLVLDADGFTNRGFKSFTDCVEASNNGFKIQWGDNFCKCLKGKLVGGVFGREEYLNQSTGESKFATKFQNFRTVDMIKKGIEPPKDKLLNPSGNNNQSFNNGGVNFDEDITPVDDGDMPF